MTPREIHVEHLIGRRVRDRYGEVVGRVEELRIGEVDGETVVLEFHAGPEALLERLGGAALKLPFLRLIPYARREYRIPWQLMDLSDENQPRLACSLSDLERSHSAARAIETSVDRGEAARGMFLVMNRLGQIVTVVIIVAVIAAAVYLMVGGRRKP